MIGSVKSAFVFLSVSVVLFYSACWSVAVSQSPLTIAEEWEQLYKEVFHENAKWHEMGRHIRLLNNIMSMHQNIDRLGEQRIVSKDMIDRAEYWYKALKDTDPGHCNVAHMNEMKKQLDQMNHLTDVNHRLMLELVHRNLVKMCAALQFDAVKDLNGYFNNAEEADLHYFFQAYDDYDRRKIPIGRLKEWVFKRMNIRSRCSTERIIEIWNKGPCGKLTTALQKMNLQSARDFALLNAYMGPTAAAECKPPMVAFWAWYINSCERLDHLMPGFAKRDPNAFKRLIVSCFGPSCS